LTEEMAKKRIEVEIFGQRYPLKSEAPEEYVKEVARLVDETMKRVAERMGPVPSVQIAVMAALYIADEYIKNEKEIEEIRKRLKEKVERLEKFLKEEGIN